jgi:3-methyl-2-oxobutanoate hydroxymethyltransferase
MLRVVGTQPGRRTKMDDKVRVATIQQMKAEARKIVAVTAYDYPTGRLGDDGGVDIIHVGDSLANILGFADEIPVTLDMILHHASAVRRGVKRALLMADMPFMAYKVTPEQALTNAARLVQEAGVEVVKMEGGRAVCPMIRKVVEAGIPVMGHIGVQPQSIHAQSGLGVKGREDDEVLRLIEEARAVEEAGAFALVLEVVGWDAARRVTGAVRIPTIGIGSGGECDGQIMVMVELIGLSFRDAPRYAKRYAQVGEAIRGAVGLFANEVRTGVYPDRTHAYLTREKT